MLSSRVQRFLDAVASLFFLTLAALLIVLASRVPYHDGNYQVFYLGFGLWLEVGYLTIHFGLKAILTKRARLIARISRILGLLLLVPVGLIILILAVLLDQSIRFSLRGYEREVRNDELIFGILILVLLVVPAFLILRDIVISFLRRRTEL